MSHCERPSAIGSSHPCARRTSAAAFRVLASITLPAMACIVASACAPLPATVAPRAPVSTASVAPASPGRIYADSVCASCHAVAAGQTRSPNPKAPTFEAIANAPGMTLMALNVALHTPHKTMPNLIVDSARIEDLSAYLYTLQK